MRFELDQAELSQLIRTVVRESLCELGWPAGRLALREHEAAAALGVARHVLRDMRLRGRIKGTRIGRTVVYSRDQVLAALSDANALASLPKMPDSARGRRSHGK